MIVTQTIDEHRSTTITTISTPTTATVYYCNEMKYNFKLKKRSKWKLLTRSPSLYKAKAVNPFNSLNEFVVYFPSFIHFPTVNFETNNNDYIIFVQFNRSSRRNLKVSRVHRIYFNLIKERKNVAFTFCSRHDFLNVINDSKTSNRE